MRHLTAALFATLLAACGSPPPKVVCGRGTHQDGNTCVLDSKACGPGTHLANGACVPDGAPETCGVGTADDGGTCYPSPPPEICGTGTHDQNGTCVPDTTDTFVLRVPVSQLPADGVSTIQIFVVGQHADGTAYLSPVILGLSRPDAGQLSQTTVNLAADGTTIDFTPCNASTNPSCVGPFHLTLALPSDPSTPVMVSHDVTLTTPTGVSTSTPCLVGGNVLYLDGDGGDYIHPGVATLTQGTFSDTHSPTDQPNEVKIHFAPPNSPATWWDVDLGSSKLGKPLAVGIYDQAQRDAFATTGHPGMDISGDGRGCNSITGRFQVEDITMTSGQIKSFTASFEQHCEGGTPALRGCIHYGQ